MNFKSGDTQTNKHADKQTHRQTDIFHKPLLNCSFEVKKLMRYEQNSDITGEDGCCLQRLRANTILNFDDGVTDSSTFYN